MEAMLTFIKQLGGHKALLCLDSVSLASQRSPHLPDGEWRSYFLIGEGRAPGGHVEWKEQLCLAKSLSSAHLGTRLC